MMNMPLRLRLAMYTYSAKRAIYKAARAIDSRLSASMSTMSLATTKLTSHTTIAPIIKLPTIKLEHISGDIESWQRFWEQIQSSVNTNHCLTD